MTVLENSLAQARGIGRETTGPQRKKPSRQAARKPAAKTAKKTARKTPPRTARTSTAGRGRGELRELTKAALYQRAAEQDLPGRSRMSREQLVDALTRAGRRRKASAA